MDTPQLLSELRAAGVGLRVIEGRLYRRGELPPHLVEEYPRHRVALAELLRRQEHAAVDLDEDHPALALELRPPLIGRRVRTERGPALVVNRSGGEWVVLLDRTRTVRRWKPEADAGEVGP